MDPALLTFQEFWEAVNPGGKYHPSSAYDWSVERMNENEWNRSNAYPTLLFRKKISGISFEFRMKKEDLYEDNRFMKRDESGEPFYVDKKLQFYSKKELLEMNDPLFKRYNYSFAAFDGGTNVAVAQDEWGCLLVSVAQEYRQFGLGPILTKLAWEAEPGKPTGGCTPGGFKVTQKVHQEFVREYLRNGTYSKLIKEGMITLERVQEILKSAKLESRFEPSRTKQKVNLSTNDPKNFLLFEDFGAFILYDRRLKDLLEQGNEDSNSYWIDKFIKGHSFAGGGYYDNARLYLHQLGGDTPQIKKFMFTLALSYAKTEGVPLFVYNDDLNMVNPSEVELKEKNLAVMKGKPIDWRPLKVQEIQFRKTFDRYGEFHNRLLELADAKYRDSGASASASRSLIGSMVFGSWLRFIPRGHRRSRRKHVSSMALV